MDLWSIGGGGGVSLSWKLCSVMVFQGYMFNWLGGVHQCSSLPCISGRLEEGWGQSVMKIRQCNGLPDIHAQLRGVYLTPYLDTLSETLWTHFLILGLGLSVHFIWALHLITEGYIWRLIWTLHLKIWTHFLISGLGLSVHFIWALHLKTGGVYLNLNTSSENLGLSVHFIWNWGVYLTAYLNTSSENMNSFPYFWFGSQCALHLSTSSENRGGISESEHFIWKFGSQCALHLKLGGISDSLSEHFIWKYELISLFLVWVSVCTSSEHFIWKQGGISESEHFIWNLGLSVHFIWKLGGISESLSGYFILTSWPSCVLHLKTWPNSATCFERALIDT